MREFNVDEETGLSATEVENRRAQYGLNKLREHKKKSAFIILINQFKSVVMLLLFIASGVSFAFKEWIDAVAILIAIIINVVIGFITELKAIRSMEALQELDKVDAKVLRAGETINIPAEEIVPGDILIFDSGDLITADVRVIESNRAEADESILTGESVPVSKHIEPLQEDTPIAERYNLLFKGTSVTRGSGAGVVYATGMDTELGSISSLIENADEDEKDPISVRLDQVARQLVVVSIIAAVIAGAAGLIAGKELFLMIETMIVLVVAAILEGLPIVATAALARGLSRMAERNALVRRLSAVQTLGSVGFIFTDKTGTLTENQMTVTRLITGEGEFELTGEGLEINGEFRLEDRSVEPERYSVLSELIKIGVLCNNAALPDNVSPRSGRISKKQAVGDPMETALLITGVKAGLDDAELSERFPETKEYAFDPEMMIMATVHRENDAFYYAVKGAPDSVLSRCDRFLSAENETEFTDEQKREWITRNDRLAGSGLRLLAMAYKRSGSEEDDPYDRLVFTGLCALMDPPRREVIPAIEKCHEAGIRVIMVTGDQADTAMNIAQAVGLTSEGDDSQKALPGSELKSLSELNDEEKQSIIDTAIFYRVSPEQKLNLISVFQDQGDIVGMTGDGVNDAPALKKADIGIAMGKRGQRVAKEAADMILQDDSFNTVALAIEHGRTIFNNIRKFIVFLVSGNIGQILLVALASLFALPLPVLPLQILFLNVVNDVFPALALGLGEDDPDTMKYPPRDPKIPILTRKKWIEIVVFGLIISLSVLGVFIAALKLPQFTDSQAVSIAFLSLAFARLFHVFNMRDNGTRFFKNQITTNKWVWTALGFSGLQVLLVVLIPGLSEVLKVPAVGIQGWALVGAGSLFPLILGQIWRSVAK